MKLILECYVDSMPDSRTTSAIATLLGAPMISVTPEYSDLPTPESVEANALPEDYVDEMPQYGLKGEVFIDESGREQVRQ
jgi:hypothetical protein